MEGVGSFGRRGSRCQSSSVTKGMKGCSSLRPRSKHVYKVFCAERRVVADADPSVIGFIASYIRSSSEQIYPDIRQRPTHDEDITELIEPEVVDCGRC